MDDGTLIVLDESLLEQFWGLDLRSKKESGRERLEEKGKKFRIWKWRSSSPILIPFFFASRKLDAEETRNSCSRNQFHTNRFQLQLKDSTFLEVSSIQMLPIRLLLAFIDIEMITQKVCLVRMVIKRIGSAELVLEKVILIHLFANPIEIKAKLAAQLNGMLVAPKMRGSNLFFGWGFSLDLRGAFFSSGRNSQARRKREEARCLWLAGESWSLSYNSVGSY
ncbi:hypothetical protein VNO77_18837 [Canavalia gladiata]|uniref:Uncharacterized protein n=1 Tax=Canavalia gladiata TaxID=3824 RepID=A0AAN9LLJ5_CANGL